MTPEQEAQLIKDMTADGWEVDKNTDTTIGFIYIKGKNKDFEWIRDYNKSDCRFVQFNANQQVNLCTEHLSQRIDDEST